MEAFASDKECCYYTKLLTLTLGIGMDVLHNYFERKILDTKDFCTFLNIHKHCLFHERYPKIQCCECSKTCLVSSKRGSLNETQFQQLFDITPPTEKDHFQTGRNNVITKDCLCRIKANESNEVDCMDITLLCAIVNSCFINSNQSIHGYPIDFETIKATRNFLSHRPGNRISEAEFNTRWVNMEQAILGIASTVGNYFAKANKRKICALKEKALSIEGLVEIIKNNADEIKKNLLDPLEIQRNNTALVTNVKDEITQLLQKYKDEMSVDIGNLRFEVKQFTKAMSNSCPEVKVDTQGQVPHMDTAVCVSDEQMTEEGQVSLIDTAVCVSDVKVTGQDKSGVPQIDTAVCVSDVQMTEKDKNVKKCRVEWRLETPETWNLKEIKETLVKFSEMLRPWFEIEFVYVGSLVIKTLVQKKVLDNRDQMRTSIHSFLEKVVEVCKINSDETSVIRVDLYIQLDEINNKGNMLSGEEEKYMRLFMLLDICRKAVKIYFDAEFNPHLLNQTIKKAGRKLLHLKKTNVLSETQWNILQGNKLDSSDFDIPLMICLLRNLADLPISDLMPLESQKKKTDELARIKFYRNAIVHGNRSNLSDERFLIIWETICKAIRGLSDELFEECESLHIPEMDLLNKDINIRIQNAFKELSEFKKLHANPIPPNLRVKIGEQLKRWTADNANYFVNTKGSKAVINSIKEHPCVAVTGSFGTGKTAIIHNAALLMRLNGYIVVPVTDPLEIKKYKHPIEKNLFVVDNFCGICDLEEEELEAWNNCGVEFDEKCKLLVSCKLQVYRAIRHETLNNITFHECNLLSNTLCLSLNERQAIARKYNINIHDIMASIEFYNCFPLLCNYCTITNIINAKSFFIHPIEVFETQFEMLQTLDANGKVCALMILLMFYDNVPEAMITGKTDWDVKRIIANTSKASKLGTEDPYITIHKELDNLIGTYVIKKEGVYHAQNERIFNLLLRYFGNQMTEPLINYSCTSLIRERFQLSDPLKNKEDYVFSGEQGGIYLHSSATWDKVGLNAVILTDVEYRYLYVNRMLTDLSGGYVNDVFQNPNRFHVFFFQFLSAKGRIELEQLLTKTDKIDGSTPMIAHCGSSTYVHSSNEILNDIFLQWLINNGCPINISNDKGETAMFHAVRAAKDNSQMVEILINHKADINICTTDGCSPLYEACLRGYSRIANILLISGANCNTITSTGDTPLHAACFHGHTSIVTELLQRGADLSISNSNGHTPLDLARLNEHHDIVQNIMRYSKRK